MGVHTTVVFADLSGSTGVFETLGNARATDAVTRLTQWVGKVCDAHHGRVVKTLGDGVLAVFPDAVNAVEAVIEMQVSHQLRLEKWPEPLRMRLQVGVAAGEIVEVDGDCYGDAVNVASRLSDLSGADEIWANDAVIDQLAHTGVRYRSLGPISIRGKAEPMPVYRIEWEDDSSEFLTQQASISELAALRATPPDEVRINLRWLDQSRTFTPKSLPARIGRVAENEFVVNDPRVSRTHARLEWRHGSVVLVDVSSYGTWLRFADGATASAELILRRDECVLHGRGEIGLGAPLKDFTAPTLAFVVTQGKSDGASRRSSHAPLQPR
ncbi:MAG: FHA domain-containing protein [Burkholderiaceae bacterium]|nr:FHA domain-containing protein [Burkholderiaceae bacterium]